MDPFLENVFKGIKQNTQDYEENKLFWNIVTKIWEKKL